VDGRNHDYLIEKREKYKNKSLTNEINPIVKCRLFCYLLSIRLLLDCANLIVG
jgi:hypothetical protein